MRRTSIATVRVLFVEKELSEQQIVPTGSIETVSTIVYSNCRTVDSKTCFVGNVVETEAINRLSDERRSSITPIEGFLGG